jgi:hypothetical protein
MTVCCGCVVGAVQVRYAEAAGAAAAIVYDDVYEVRVLCCLSLQE